MKRRAFRKNPRRAAAASFSLVELLTVIAIIVLLIGILIPAVNAVRRTARTTATEALIGTFSTGVETFRADQQVGGGYPPSASDRMVSNALTYEVASPYALLPGGPDGLIEISGAGLLVWALAGADLLGTPGFRPFHPRSTWWAQSTTADPGSDGAYELDPDTREPLRPRTGPFVDLSKLEVTRWNEQAEARGGPGSFEIPAEAEAAEARGAQPWRRNYPMFLDAFGGPILYYRADPAGFQIADRSPTDGAASGNQRGVYHFRDNSALLDVDEQPLMLTASDKPHRLAFDYPAPLLPDDIDLTGAPGTYNFVGYIRNTAVEARVAPQNKGSFLLITAGADGVFGTGDDVANFEHNGAELREP